MKKENKTKQYSTMQYSPMDFGLYRSRTITSPSLFCKECSICILTHVSCLIHSTRFLFLFKLDL